MKISEIFERDEEDVLPYNHQAGHPFRHAHNAYPLTDPHSVSQAQSIYKWTTNQYGASAPMPEIWIVNHQHMQDAVLRASHVTEINGHVFGWYSQRFPTKVFLSDQVKFVSNKMWGAILVHEFVHYLQDVTDKHDTNKPFQPEYVQTLEDEADALMNVYLKSK